MFLSILLATLLAHAETRLPDRTTAPERSSREVEVVGKYEMPPGHVAISKTGRIFQDAGIFDPAAKLRVFELKNGKLTPFPAPAYQKNFKTVHGVYVDDRDRLWVLDNGQYGSARAPHVFAYDINSGKELVSYAFPADVAGLGSMINDVVVDTGREMAFISDTSPIAGKSSIVIYDIRRNTSRRILRGHVSVKAADHPIYVEGKPFTVIGLFHPKFGIDPIALDPKRDWIYYGPFNAGAIYRVPVAAAVDDKLPESALEKLVEKVGDTTMSDGIFVDERHDVYLSDVEHSAVVRLNANGKLETLFKDPRFRWPTDFVPSPDGYLYFTCNAIHQITLQSRAKIKELGPYYLYRFKP